MHFRSLGSGVGVSTAEIGAVCAVVWRGAVTKETFEIQRRALAEVVDLHARDGAGFLCIIEPSATPPDDALRRASADMITGHGAKLRCVATVIEGSGLKASIARSVLGGIALLARKRETEVSYFKDLRSGISWMTEHMAISSTEQVLRCVEEMRQALTDSTAASA